MYSESHTVNWVFKKNKIMPLLNDIMILIGDNINTAIILKTIKLKNIINFSLKIFSGKLSLYCMVIIAELSKITQLPLYADKKSYSVELKLLIAILSSTSMIASI